MRLIPQKSHGLFRPDTGNAKPKGQHGASTVASIRAKLSKAKRELAKAKRAALGARKNPSAS